ncbi:reverse transcriptase domain-containing protein [Tanacetum coccineum]|uniref:Reverse transcriptase domain-containing protein n=1 Tax=Tanacetum coccineum TaxID=301880 RepID=A0ABQ5D6V2_9ASTR
MEKFKTPPDSPPIAVIDPGDQPIHMQMIQDNQFDGRIRSDPHRHVAGFLEISNLFQYGKNQEEVVMLRTFPFSLSGETKTWLNELNKGTITPWNELREALISQYFSPAKFKRLLNEIHSFHQLDHETLVDAWLRIKSMLRACYGHGLTKGTIIQIFYHGIDDPIQGNLDSGGIFLSKTPNETFKILNDKVLLKLDFLNDSQNNPNPKTIVSAGRCNINSDHSILMEKFEALVIQIDEMMREWMARQTEANEHMKNQVVELEHKINQGLRNRQAIIENLERQFEYLEKIQPTKSFPNCGCYKDFYKKFYNSLGSVPNRCSVV